MAQVIDTVVQLDFTQLHNWFYRQGMTAEEVGEWARHVGAELSRGNKGVLDGVGGVRRVKYMFRRGRVLLADRRAVLAAGRCKTCGSTERLTVDHIQPIAEGGGNELANLQCLCRSCNARKGKKWGRD